LIATKKPTQTDSFIRTIEYDDSVDTKEAKNDESLSDALKEKALQGSSFLHFLYDAGTYTK